MTSSKEITVSVVEAIGSSQCLDTADGQRLHDIIATHFEAGRSVKLSFAGVDDIITAFLNAAIGQLYNEFSEDRIKASLRFEETTPLHARAIVRVIERAKQFFKNKAAIESATSAVLEK